MSKFFVDSPARRDLYIQLNTVTIFPLKFCPTRWTENEDVAARAIQTWYWVKAAIDHFQGLSQSQRPKNNKSFDTLIQYSKDPLMIVKFHVFEDIAAKLNVFLKGFQTDSPMVPFISDVLEAIIRDLMKRFVLKSQLEKAETPYKLIKLDLETDEHLLPVDQV